MSWVPIRKKLTATFGVLRTLTASRKMYWVAAALFAALGIFFGDKLNENLTWIDSRYAVYQYLQYRLSPRKPHPQRTILVLITDDEYWKGSLDGRAPIKRDYLADLIEKIAAADPAVIALDFDFRSPAPDGTPLEFPAYQTETDQLVQSIKNVASSGKKIVLTKSLGIEDNNLVVDSDIYGDHLSDSENVTTGFHVLSDDVRVLPLTVDLGTGKTMDSFCLALAKADNVPSLKDISDFEATYYAGFIPADEYPKLTANQVLNHAPEVRMLAHKVVIVSGIWHLMAYNRGDVTNSYPTPSGMIPGSVIHANYFEALLDSRFYRVWEGWYGRLFEFILALQVALAFHLILPWWKKTAMITLTYVAVVLISYVSLINFGWFFDPLIPVVMVTAHGIVEQVRGWKKQAGEHAAISETQRSRASGVAPGDDSEVRGVLPQFGRGPQHT